MTTIKLPAALESQLTEFRTSVGRDRAAATAFMAPTADFLASAGIVRGVDRVSGSLGDLAVQRAAADVVASRLLDKGMYLVDSMVDAGDSRTWFCEIWQTAGRNKFTLQLSRARNGSPERAFAALGRTQAAVVGDTVPAAAQAREEAALRKGFKAFRTAFNEGDPKKMSALWSPKCDAMPVFSFIGGRSQILAGRAAIREKGDRMAFGATVSNPNPMNATIAGGEPKSIRFLSATVAAVDGTAELSNIPAAHGFAPREMRGVYTDVWRKYGASWQIEASRAWF